MGVFLCVGDLEGANSGVRAEPLHPRQHIFQNALNQCNARMFVSVG